MVGDRARQEDAGASGYTILANLQQKPGYRSVCCRATGTPTGFRKDSDKAGTDVPAGESGRPADVPCSCSLFTLRPTVPLSAMGDLLMCPDPAPFQQGKTLPLRAFSDLLIKVC